jgi:hypothetical protein
MGPPALLENRNELKLIRNSDSTYVNTDFGLAEPPVCAGTL